jgi:hypothetical protein
MGYNSVIFGFLDQWDEDLSFLEYYGRSEAVPGLIPDHFRDKNRAARCVGVERFPYER